MCTQGPSVDGAITLGPCAQPRESVCADIRHHRDRGSGLRGARVSCDRPHRRPGGSPPSSGEHMTSRSTTKVALAAAAAGSLLLLSACGGDTKPAAGSDSGSGSGSGGDNKNVVFSPIGLQIPAMQQLSEGVKGYGSSKGYTVTVQDPSLDPQKQATDLTSVISSGSVGGAWVISVA